MPSIFALLTGQKQKRLTIQVPKDDGTAKELLVVDAAPMQTFTGTAEPTSNPVETGSKVTDNVDVRPDEFSFDGVMSDSPISLEDALLGNVAGVVGGAIGSVTSSPLAGAVATGAVAALGGALLGTSKKRSQDAYNALEEVRKKGLPVTIVTGLRTYNNMVMRSLVVTRNKDTANSIQFSAAFREVRIVSSLIIKIPKEALAEAVKHSASSQTDLGQQSTEEAEESLADKFAQKSALKILFGG